MTGKYGIGAVVLGKWRIERKIGEGSFGTVYEIRREEFGQTYTAALKVITVPRSGVEYQAALDDGMSGPEAEQYFYSVVEDIVREFAIMSKLKDTDHPNDTSKTYSRDGVLLTEDNEYNNTLYLYDSEGKLVRTLSFSGAMP